MAAQMKKEIRSRQATLVVWMLPNSVSRFGKISPLLGNSKSLWENFEIFGKILTHSWMFCAIGPILFLVNGQILKKKSSRLVTLVATEKTKPASNKPTLQCSVGICWYYSSNSSANSLLVSPHVYLGYVWWDDSLKQPKMRLNKNRKIQLPTYLDGNVIFTYDDIFTPDYIIAIKNFFTNNDDIIATPNILTINNIITNNNMFSIDNIFTTTHFYHQQQDVTNHNTSNKKLCLESSTGPVWPYYVKGSASTANSFYLHQICRKQCDQDWRNFSTLSKF